MLAQKSCNHGLPCLEKVVKVMAGCAKRDSTFWDQSILIVEEKLSSEMVQNVISEMIGSMETDDPFRMLVERVCEGNFVILLDLTNHFVDYI